MAGGFAVIRARYRPIPSSNPRATMSALPWSLVALHIGLEDGVGRGDGQAGDRLVDKNEYKRRQGPIGIKITPHAFGKDWRLPIVNRFQE
jgi:NAD+ synthase (glutamine-hydrolysing)